VPPVTTPDNQPFAELSCELTAHTGLPAIVVPAGFTPAELLFGVELPGRAFDERRLFELTYVFEQATGHRRPSDRFSG
jgi:Asp-tRNA(Asn)/Glu-tRNA(Gln) amidotransferase A subunit family amidase